MVIARKYLLIRKYFSIHPDNFKQEQFHQSQGKPHDNLGGQHYKQPLRSLPLESNTGHGHPYSDHGVVPGVTSIKTEQPEYNKSFKTNVAVIY